jgi:hypothetical protein
MIAAHRTRLIVASLMALAAFAGTASAQSTAVVQGQVVAKADGSALPGTTVTLAAGNVARETTTDGESDHAHAESGESAARVPGHVTTDASIGIDLVEDARRQPRLTLRLDVQNLASALYLIARDSEFSPAQYSTPRAVSLTARVRF